MNNKPYFELSQRLNLIEVMAASVLLLGLGANPPRLEAAVPDWLRAAARIELPKYPGDPNAVILLDEQVTTISDGGEVKTVYRRAARVLRPEGRYLGTVAVYFDSETRLTGLRAWSLAANGQEYEVKEKDAVETGAYNETLYEDTRHKVLHIPAPGVGSVVGYEYEQKRRPYIAQDTWDFQSDLPVKRSRYVLRLPDGWEYRTFWLNHAAVNPQPGEKNQLIWEVDDIAPIEDEPSMPDWRSLAGRMGISYFARSGGNNGGNAASWQAVGAWYARLAEGRRRVSPEIHQKVVELTSGAAQPSDKIRALANFVQKDIRYVAIEIGIGGYQPHEAGQVFAHRYGDCKDKATLLSAMLGDAGIKSHYVLVNAHRGVVSPDLPTMLEFNHVILAIEVPTINTQDHFEAKVQHAKLGQILYFDPTDSTTPLGDLPPSLQANYGMLVSDEGGEMVKLPLIAPALNRLVRAARLTITPTGGIYGAVEEIRWGYPARDLRVSLLALPEADRAKFLESFLSSFLGGYDLISSKIENLEAPDDALVVHYQFQARDYAKAAGNLLLVRPRVMGSKDEVALEVSQGGTPQERKHPVEFAAATLQSDIFDIKLPDGYDVDELPSPVTVDLGAVLYRSKVAVEGRTMHYTRVYQINDVLIPVDHLAELKKFYRQIGVDERSSAVLKQVGPLASHTTSSKQ